MSESSTNWARFPVVSLGAEYLVMGHLLRRNILTYKAPPGNEGYDLLCMHPNPRKADRQLRIQVKSRMATDSDRGFPMRATSLGAFDFLIVVFLNVGYYYKKALTHTHRAGAKPPEIYTLTPQFIRAHLEPRSIWQKVQTRGADLSAFADEKGFELIARALGVPYPRKAMKG